MKNPGKTKDISLIREICQDLLLGASERAAARRFDVARSSVQRYRAALINASVETPEDLLRLNDPQLSMIIYGPEVSLAVRSGKARVKVGRQGRTLGGDVLIPDFKAIAASFGRKRHLLKTDCYRDYVREAESLGRSHMGRTAFLKRLNPLLENGPAPKMHRTHVPGEDLEFDWAGDHFFVIGPDGATQRCEVFVIVWAWSGYVYAGLMPDQTVRSTVLALRQALLAFGVKPKRLLIDNARAMVTSHEYGREADFQATFRSFATRCGIFLNANNPRKPNEKSLCEESVKLVQDRVIKRMIDGTADYDKTCRRMAELTDEFINRAPFRGSQTETRAYLFENTEKPAAKAITGPLPDYTEHFEFLPVDSEYLVTVRGNRYSVPFWYVGTRVSAVVGGGVVTLCSNGTVIAEHSEFTGRSGMVSVKPEHMPPEHRAQAETEAAFPDRKSVIRAAAQFSRELAAMCSCLMERDQWEESKKGAIAILRYYMRNRADRAAMDAAMRYLMAHEDPSRLSSRSVFSKTHEYRKFQKATGSLPQEALECVTPGGETRRPAVGGDGATAFIRGASGIKGGNDNGRV